MAVAHMLLPWHRMGMACGQWLMRPSDEGVCGVVKGCVAWQRVRRILGGRVYRDATFATPFHQRSLEIPGVDSSAFTSGNPSFSFLFGSGRNQSLSYHDPKKTTEGQEQQQQQQYVGEGFTMHNMMRYRTSPTSVPNPRDDNLLPPR